MSDIAKKAAPTIKVDLKTSPSSPRRDDEIESPPHTRPNPVPLTCKSINPINVTERTI